MQSTSSFMRDANRVPIQRNGLMITKSVTLAGSNATVNVPLFSVTGQVEVIALYGIVTTTLGSNQTAAYWRLQDQTAQVNISLNTGTAVSSAGVGSVIARISVVTIALSLKNSTAGGILDPIAATAPDEFMPFIAVQKVGSIKTEIEYVYTTNQTPTTGAITFYAGFVPLTSNSDLTASTTVAY